jgi:LPS-assembly protein
MNIKFLNKIIFILFFFFVFSLNLLTSTNAENSLFEIRAKKVTYDNNDNLIIATGLAEATNEFGEKIFSDKIIYDKTKSTIQTDGYSIYLDGKGNKLFADNFFYNLNTKIIKANSNVEYIDVDSNIFKFSSFEYSQNSESGIGSNLIANLNDGSSSESNIAEIDNKNGLTTMRSNNDKKKLSNFIKTNKNYYTTCLNLEKSEKKIEERCTDWSITSDETLHDKNKRMLYHKNAVLKLRNIPLFYTPYFSHPDPSVKRMSGILPPSTKNFVNLGRTFKTPYFWVIDENKDLTFTPILYMEENSIFLTEYRQQNKNSNLYIDSSYSKGYKNFNKKDENGNLIPRTGGSRNHLFFGFEGKYDNLLLAENDLSIKIQRISQKNYLKVNQINTDFVKESVSGLANNIILNTYGDTKKITLEAAIYESLGTDEKNKKYSYTLPYISYSDFFRFKNQNTRLNNSFIAQNLGENINKSEQINQINLSSDQKVYKILDGISHVYKSTLSNANSYNQNVSGEKENFSSDANIIFGLENAYPLIKYNNDFSNEQTITPKVFTKYVPGEMNDISGNGKVIGFGDIYSMNRTGSASNPDRGLSLGYGAEYEINKKNKNNDIYMNGKFSLGQVLRNKKLNEMSINSTLGETKSDFAGEASFYFNKNKILYTEENDLNNSEVDEGYKINYDYIVNNNLNKILQSNLSTSYSNIKNEFTGKYHESHDVGNAQYIELEYKRKFDNFLNFSAGIRKNIEKSFTEKNHIDVYYDSDCLRVGLSLAKKFYSGEDIKNEKTLVFNIIIKPFGAPISPANLGKYIDKE